ncbi:tetratricopeptide repeat protein [Pseudanabaena sp. ABRG5-3]|uniref:tetratricopeptide repeat protein n=1 Tax=Pseudanabaena sp. ABRG5-3 TaxID=685565 RepID=UPI000DC740AC|nr:tetratricopeptide repeat protein [Pseudanabaena sp. ABRG5-3]BBC23262.1 tetratricopeptide [Pseudanabaena sp. ABRG5-3]
MILSRHARWFLWAVSLAALPWLMTVAPSQAQELGGQTQVVAQADRKAEADRLLQQGIQQCQTGQCEAAFQSWEQALTIYRAIKDRLGEGKALGNLGIAYYALGKYDKAIEFHLQALAILRETKKRQGEGSVLGNLGLAYYALGKYDKAIEFQLQSLAIKREIKDRLGEGQSLGNLGSAYYSLGKYDKAIEFYSQHLAIAREIKDRLGEGQSLGNLGSAYYSLGKYDKAIEFYSQSLAIKREIKDRLGEGQSLGNLGLAYNALGKYDKAIEFQLQSLAIAREIKARLGEGQSLGNLGLAYFYLGKYDKAIEFQLQSLAIAREIKDRLGEGNSLGNLGNAYDALGKYDKAIEFYSQTLAIAREIKDRSGEMNGLNDLGETYEKLNRDREAMISFQQALTIAREIGDRSVEGYALANLGIVLSRAKRPELAILFYKQSINVREAIRKDIKKLDKDIQHSYLATVADTYRNLADLLLQQNRIMEALQILDLLKIQELEDYLKNIKGNDRTSQGVSPLAPEKAISDQLLAISFENAPDINNQLASQIQQLPKTEINKVPDYLNQIPAGTVLLYPFILGDRLELILFAPNTLPIHRTVAIKQTELEELIKDFRGALQDSGTEDFREPSQKFYNLLIKPIESELINTKTIFYAPDGILRYVPLAALYDGKQWLAEKYRINNLIAYSLSDFKPQPKIEPSILAGAFGGKAGEYKFGQKTLPFTIGEVRMIAKTFTNSNTLEENDFSRQATETGLKQHSILHLATHAEFNAGSPDDSRIFFGNGDILKLREISDLSMQNINLIVLSACQTGLSGYSDGVEILGFGYQVQKAGAKQAIASLWSVSDEGTQALMSAFYRELQKGDVTAVEALHRAQISLIKSEKFNHPNYWSAFFAIGNGL